jgi:hypothetical protein
VDVRRCLWKHKRQQFRYLQQVWNLDELQSTRRSPAGVQVAFLEGTGSVTQTISGFTAGNMYTITVAASQRQTTTQSGPNPFKIMVNGTSIGTFSPPQSIGYYEDYGASFPATATSNTIAFVGTSSSGTSAVLLDNVRIGTAGTGTLTIAAQSTSIIYGAGSTVLTASATLSNGPILGLLVFQVGSGSQIPGVCTVSGSTDICTVTYPTANLPLGNNRSQSRMRAIRTTRRPQLRRT